ncbi:serine hydrolase [Bacteroidota bacterium]
MKKLAYFLPLFLLLFVRCEHNDRHDDRNIKKGYDETRLERITAFQQDLINSGTTGSNIAMVYKDGEIIYKKVINSGKEGDADITRETIFPVWSMSKPITSVAAMILYEEGKFGWSGYHNTHFWIDQEKNLFGLFMTRRTPYSQDIQRQFRRAVYQAIY